MFPWAEQQRRRARRRRRLATALLLCACAAGLLSTLHRGLVEPQPSKLVVDRRARYLGEVPGHQGDLGYWPLPVSLPERIVRATLETEDRFFFAHAGVHVPSIGRALWQNVRHLRRVSGASTLPMQVARMQRPARRGLLAKVREAGEALLLVHDFGHERVLRQYLTLAPYGNRVHGVVRAARLYFDKPIEDLSWAQAAFLAGLPQMPGRMNPFDPDGLARARRRAKRILRTLHARGVIDRAELERSLDADLGLAARPRREPAALHAVLAWSEDAARRAGPIVTATLDLDAETRAAGILRDHLARLQDAGAGNGAVLVADLPSGDILAWVGSRDYFDTDERGAIDYVRARRSPGSALKPFIYALALERGTHTAASDLPDVPTEFAGDDGAAYLPENMGHQYFGPMLLRNALASSRNLPALRVLSDVGIEPALRFFEKAGVRGIEFEPGRYGLGVALGGLETTLEELAGLYGLLAREGETLPLRRFVDDPPGASKRVLSRAAAQTVRHILSDPEARRPVFSAGGPLDFDYAVAVKTGTSQGHRDAWAAAFSDRLLVAAWVGNHDRRRMNRVTGASAAANVVHDVMNALMPERAPHRTVLSEFPPPAGFVAHAVCPLSGRLAGPHCPDQKTEWFAPGGEPFEHCPWHTRVPMDRRNGLRAGPGCPPRFVVSRAMLDLPEEYARWAHRRHLEVAPVRPSPLCPGAQADADLVLRIREPRRGARYLYDPETPAEAGTIRFSAEVHPPGEEIVWIVNGSPVARVGWPHELRWSLPPGTHTVGAALAQRSLAAEPVTVVVDD